VSRRSISASLAVMPTDKSLPPWRGTSANSSSTKRCGTELSGLKVKIIPGIRSARARRIAAATPPRARQTNPGVPKS
jgi:hypothetical protein